MPNKASMWYFFRIIPTKSCLFNCLQGIDLIGTHKHVASILLIIWIFIDNQVVAHHLMSHWNHQKMLNDFSEICQDPLSQMLTTFLVLLGDRPMKNKGRIKIIDRFWRCKIPGFDVCCDHHHLRKGHEVIGIFPIGIVAFKLTKGLVQGLVTPLLLNVNQGQTVNQ